MSENITYELTLAITSDPAGANIVAEAQVKAMAEKIIGEVNIQQGGTTIKTSSLIEQ